MMVKYPAAFQCDFHSVYTNYYYLSNALRTHETRIQHAICRQKFFYQFFMTVSNFFTAER